LVAHRGYRAACPENSVVGIRAALAAGIHHVECDVQFSRDGVAMLYHDLSLGRVSGIDGTLLDYDAAELVKLPAGEPARLGDHFADVTIEPLSALLAILDDYPTATCFVEVKEQTLQGFALDALIAPICDLFAEHRQQVVFISYSTAVIATARQHNWPRCGVVLHALSDALEPAILALQAEYYFIDQLLIDASFSRTTEQHDTQWVAFEVGDHATGLKLLDDGFDLLESFTAPTLMEPRAEGVEALAK
jgi:glycerophosphoryl diester phosphodiesterase